LDGKKPLVLKNYLVKKIACMEKLFILKNCLDSKSIGWKNYLQLKIVWIKRISSMEKKIILKN
jgi:hypothetical protein